MTMSVLSLPMQATQTFRCPLCHGDGASPLRQFGVHSIVRCQRCGFFATHPVPSKEMLRVLYDEQYYGGRDAARFCNRLADRVQRGFRWWRAVSLARYLGGVRGRRILDVGCDRGSMLSWLQRWGAEVYGVQVSRPAAEAAARRIGCERVFIGELAEAAYPDAWFDCVTLWHVLEHVLDPVALLREIRRIMKADGVVYVEVPNAGGWSAEVFGGHWLAYDVPKHLVHFTPDSLQAVASKAGLQCVVERHMSWEHSPVTLLQSFLSAWLGGHHLLFRSVSHEASVATRVSFRWVLHLSVALVCAIPAALVSWWLALSKRGDTLGAFFRIDPRASHRGMTALEREEV